MKKSRLLLIVGAVALALSVGSADAAPRRSSHRYIPHHTVTQIHKPVQTHSVHNGGHRYTNHHNVPHVQSVQRPGHTYSHGGYHYSAPRPNHHHHHHHHHTNLGSVFLGTAILLSALR